MNKYKLDLNEELGSIEVEIHRKNIKNINLRVCPNGNVRVSVPTRTNSAWIESHLIAKRPWIIKQLSKFGQHDHCFELEDINTADAINFLGKKIKINLIQSSKNYFELAENELNFHIISNKTQSLDKIFLKFWKNCAKNIFQKELDNLFDEIFRPYNIAKPSMHVRRMKTLWGSCIPKKNKITINEHLLKKDIKCIQYVILHELTHLLHIKHNKDFYDFLTAKMPNWKEYKQALATRF